MGYTHYYQRRMALGMDGFAAFSEDAARLVSAAAERGIELAGLMGKPDTVPEVNANRVAFNGSEEGAHEGFLLEWIFEGRYTQTPDSRGHYFDCCKTARKPYDTVVAAVLIAARHRFGADIRVSSDGEDSEWDPARDLCQDVLGYGKDFSLDR